MNEMAIPELVWLSAFIALAYGIIHSLYDYYNPPRPHTTWLPVVIGVAVTGVAIHLMILGVTGDVAGMLKIALVYSACYLLSGLPMIFGQILAAARREDRDEQGDIKAMIDRVNGGRG